MNNVKKIIFTLIGGLYLMPTIASAQNGIAGRLIVCNKDLDSVKANSSNACDFNDLIRVADLLVDVLIQLALAITILLLIITGAKYLFAGSADAKSIAKGSLKNILIGFAFILGAYLIVNTILYIGGVDSSFNLLE